MAQGVEEKVIEEGEFKQNLLVPWIPTKIKLTNRRVHISKANSIFRVIPFGKEDITMPLNQISSVYTSTEFHVKRFLAGIIFTLIGLGSIVPWGIINLLFLLFGILNLANSYTAKLIVANNANQKPGIEISILDKNNLLAFSEKVNSVIAEKVG